MNILWRNANNSLASFDLLHSDVSQLQLGFAVISIQVWQVDSSNVRFVSTDYSLNAWQLWKFVFLAIELLHSIRVVVRMNYH